jgi:beta-glucuronidase
MDRGIPQQMLSEMDLRDMNHPAVLFHGLANESTGGGERQQALTVLHKLDRQNDGTRLTGQAAYASQPNDPTSAPLDVAGYTSYYGVFYQPDAATGTAQALRVMHATYPSKPVMLVEFGRWADDSGQEGEQKRILADTYQAAAPLSDTSPGGFVGATVWWTLDDYWTQRPGIKIEHFGLYSPNGDARPAGLQAADLFSGGAGQGPQRKITSSGTGSARQPAQRSVRFLGYLAYALTLALGIPAAILLVLLLAPRRRRREMAR